MKPVAGQDLLLRLHRRWTWIQRARLFLLALAAGTLAAGCAAFFSSSLEIQILACFGAFGLGLMALRRPAASPRDIALHYNRAYFQLEESCQLLLEEASRLPLLQQLQRRKIEPILERLGPGLRLPRKPIIQALLLLAICTVTAGAISRAGGGRDFAPPVSARLPVPERAAAPLLAAVRIDVVPPAYTGRPRRAIDDAFTIEAEQGAAVTWNVQFQNQTTAARLHFADGPDLPLDGAAGRFSGTLEAAAPALYRLEAEGPGGRLVGDWEHLQMIPDTAPQVRILAPAIFTSIPEAGPGRLEVGVALEDDYGLKDARLMATVGKGSGENIRFRDAAIPFQRIGRSSATRWEARSTIDLSDLEMEPGDELYFHAEARDNRPPRGRTSRSETRFVRWQGETRVSSPLAAGLPVYAMPEYFRSQRQIILDTEKLIADAPSLARTEFESRSNQLGLDQQVLRLRYGQFLGEETSEDSEHSEAAGSTVEGPASILQTYGHSHDSSLEASFFSDSIRTQLKAALSQMWESEARLRTHRPSDSLRFQYQALSLLKEVQQRSRLYVKKAGFEPAPISVTEKRLTGKLSEIRSSRSSASREPSPEKETVRRVLEWLARLESGTSERRPDLQADLESAGTQLARLALGQPGRYLESLNQLRRLADSLSGGGEVCQACILGTRRGLWALLPDDGPSAAPGVDPASSLALEYFSRLEAMR